jgi:hypothetical protein
VPQICCPAPFTVNVPLAKLALPATPTAPISLSNQPEEKSFAANTVSATVVEFANVPHVPVTVTVAGPVVATLLAISVNVLEPGVGFGLNRAVTPLGKPEIDKVTLLLKPFCGARVIAVMPLPPCGIPKPFGDAESVKFGPGFTVTETVAVWVKPPTVPVTVTVAVPVVAVFVAVSVMVLEPVAGFGVKDAVTPVGSPEADKLTPLVKPLCGVTVTLLVPLDP